MDNWKGTKGIWRNPEGTTFINCGEKSICDYAGYKTTEDEDDANAQLIIDAGNTIQSCGLLPSQLLKQRDEMRSKLEEVVEHFYNNQVPAIPFINECENLIKSTNP